MSDTANAQVDIAVKAPRVLNRLRNKKVAAAATLVVVVVATVVTAKFAKDHVDLDVDVTSATDA